MSKQDYFRRSLTSKKVLLLSKKDLKSDKKYFFESIKVHLFHLQWYLIPDFWSNIN